jgi:hypothetical protein
LAKLKRISKKHYSLKFVNFRIYSKKNFFNLKKNIPNQQTKENNKVI